MKRLRFMLVALLLFSSSMVSAASLVYTPATLALTIPAGSEQQFLLKVGIDNPAPSTYYLSFLNEITSGNLPLAWLTASPSSSFLFGGSDGSSMLTVSVPTGTPSGTYTGTLLSRAMAAHDIAVPANGIRLDVTVPSQCSGMPAVTITSIEPKILWPPNHSMTQVIASGTVSMPAGCAMKEAGYAVVDEYGVYSGIYPLKIQSDNSFTVALPLEAMRFGQDKDGRHYAVTFYAINQAGSGSSPEQVIVVPHDQSNNR